MIQPSNTTHTKDLREQVNGLLEMSRWAEAHRALGDFWRQKNMAAAPYILSCHEKMRGHLPLTECRISFLRSLTLEPLMPALRSAAFVSGIDATVQVGQFNMYAQEILDPESALYSFKPNIVVLAIQTRDILPEIWEGYADLSESNVNAALTRIHDSFANWVRAFRNNCNASLVIHTLEKPLASFGVLDAQSSSGQLSAINHVNEGLRKIAGEHRGVYLLDYDALMANHGRARWHDEAKWLTMRMPFAGDSMLPLVSEWMKFIHPLTGKVCKVLAVDLDNTLWGGVLGEDGAEGIRMDSEYPGAFYRAVQRAILDLHQRGILLAACSKNNQDEAMAVLKGHRDMLIRPEHFAAFRINWQDKAQNIREIAAELNLGIDSIAFLDDNPVERERVRTDLSEVKVIEVPGHAKGFAQALRDFPYFERLTLSEEERKLTSLYHEQQKRAELEHSAGSLEDFYRSLHQEVVIAPATGETISRVAQLTQKTNQYNVTTRRYTEQQIEEFVSQPGWGVYSVRVKDRFGDNGIVGVLITKNTDDVCEIDTFLLSCRVIGRTIETAMLGFAAEKSRATGANSLQGWFLPTKKNAPVKELYASHQFRPIATEKDGTLWSLDLTEADIPCPEWIQLHVPNGPNHTEQQPSA